MVQQIAAAWEHAKAQLEKLKLQVERAGELAEVKAKRDDLAGARDRAFRDLGAHVYELTRQGKVALPASASASLRAVEAAHRQLEDQAREINDLLKEGEEVSEKLRAAQKAAGGLKSTVAGKPKKG